MKAKELGDFGENIAAQYLRRKGYKILEQNFKRKWGEIDIVARQKGIITFFEIKSIFQNPEFYPEDKISWKKKKQLLKISQIYLSENKIPPGTPHQIDIIAIAVSRSLKKTKIYHYKNAVEDQY